MQIIESSDFLQTLWMQNISPLAHFGICILPAKSLREIDTVKVVIPQQQN